MVSEIMRALGLIAAGALLVLIVIVGRPDRRDTPAWDDWEQTEGRDP